MSAFIFFPNKTHSRLDQRLSLVTFPANICIPPLPCQHSFLSHWVFPARIHPFSHLDLLFSLSPSQSTFVFYVRVLYLFIFIVVLASSLLHFVILTMAKKASLSQWNSPLPAAAITPSPITNTINKNISLHHSNTTIITAINNPINIKVKRPLIDYRQEPNTTTLQQQ